MAQLPDWLEQLMVKAHHHLNSAISRRPSNATIGSWAFVIHGGLPRVKDVGLDDFDTINRIRQPPLKLESRDDHLLFDSLWADPHEGDGVIEGSARGGFSIQFGMDVTKEFCRR